MYKPLDQEKLEIRLLTLLAGPTTASICCELNTTSLGDYSKHKEGVYCWGTGKTYTHETFEHTEEQRWVPEYEALSYAWGTPARGESRISLNGSTFPVTSNLESALRALRYEDKDRVLWIDAVCINQDDLRERSEQVQIMANIYQRARATVAWAGHADKSSDRALHLIERLGGDRKFLDEFPKSEFYPAQRDWVGPQFEPFYDFHGGDIAASNSFQSYLGSLQLLGLDQLSEEDWSDLSNFFSRDYWTRIWVVQEIANAQSVELHCGRNSISWDSLTSMIENPKVRRSSASLKARFFDVIEPGVNGLIEQRKYTRHGSRHALLEETTNTFLNLLIRFRPYQSSDPRDKIYALLGLSSVDKDMALPRPDYSKPVAEIYCELFESLIKHYANLDIFTLLGTDNLLRLNGLPSWAPDLSASLQPYATSLNETRNFRASKDSIPEGPSIHCNADWFTKIIRLPPSLKPFAVTKNNSEWQDASGMIKRPYFDPAQSHPGTIALHGYLVDLVKTAGPSLPVSHDSPTEAQISSFTQQAESLFLRQFDHASLAIDFSQPWPQWEKHLLPRIRPGLIAFLTTLIKNSIIFNTFQPASVEYPIEYLVDQYLVWSGRLHPSEARPETALNSLHGLVENLRRSLPGWRFCITHESTHSLLPCHAEEGDWVAIMHGGDVPFAIRQVDPYSPNFYLVGPAVVPHCMYGNVFEEAEREMQKLVFTFI